MLDLRRAACALPLSLLLACEPGSNTQPAPPVRVPGSEATLALDPPSEEAARLHALGYVEVVGQERADVAVGAHLIDPARVQQGLNFYVNAHLCSAELMTLDGSVLRRWSHEPCLKWGNAVLTPKGEVLVIHRNPGETADEVFRARELLKFDWQGQLLWSRQLPVHHDVDVTPDGRIATLAYRLRVIPRFHSTIPVRDHYVTLLDPDGNPIEEASLSEILVRSPAFPRFRERDARRHDGQLELDLIHSNSIEWLRDPELAQQNSLYGTGNVLVCSRSQDSLWIIDWRTKRVVWSWGRGKLSGPHDATMLSNGNVLVFDNGLRNKSSRIVEVDPRTNEIVWSYQDPNPQSFFSSHRGAAQRLPNGNTLITDSGGGRAFEVTADGEIVWTFVNPNRDEDGSRVVIVRMRRVQPSQTGKARFDWSD